MESCPKTSPPFYERRQNSQNEFRPPARDVDGGKHGAFVVEGATIPGSCLARYDDPAVAALVQSNGERAGGLGGQ